MSDFRYLVTQLYQSGSTPNPVIAEIPLTNVNFSQEINSNGAFSGEVLLSGLDPNMAANIVNSTIPAKYCIYVEYAPTDGNGVIVWGGVIWTREYDSANQILSINAQELMSYFTRRRIQDTTVYTNQDPMTIANSLITYAQGKTYGNIGVQTNSNTSGFTVSRTYYNFELKEVYQAIKDLSTGLDSATETPFFDFNITPIYNSSHQIVKYFESQSPYLGNNYPTNPITTVFDFPGNIVSYTYPEDGTTAANRIYGLGYGANTTKLLATANDPSAYGSNGFPLLEESASFIDVNDPTLLKAVTVGQVNAKSYPPTTVQVIVPSYISPNYGTYFIGDFVRLAIFDDFFSNGTNYRAAGEIYRITSINVVPGEDKADQVTITLTLPLATTGTVA